jgi:tetratricopeptide (TPR) repeat protein
LLGVLCALALGSGTPRLQAASAPDALERPNQLYERGKFAEAAVAYEELIRSGSASPALFFNLGNAHFKAGHLGYALLNYHRAEELAPRDPDIRANLQFVRNSVPGANLRPASRWVRWLPRLTLNEAAFVAAIAFWVWLGLLTLRQLRPTTRRPLRAATVLAGLLTVILVAFTAANWHLRRAVLTAIVVVPEATVHHGPLDESPSAFSVRDGFELEATDTKGDWLQVTDAARRIGWLKQEHAVLFPVMAGRAPRR